jgi:micrococcal nuclease
VLLVVLLAAGLAVIRWQGSPENAAPAGTPNPDTSGSGGTPTGVPPGAQLVTVGFAKDGDTIQAYAPAAGPVLPTVDRVDLRLLGIDAPEMHAGPEATPQCYARDAYQALQRLAPARSRLWVVADEQPRDPYQRFLVYAWTADGRFVNLELARLGYARPLNIPPNNRYEAPIGGAVEEARVGRRGLWGACVG